MTTKSDKSARVPFATLSRFIKMEMEAFHAGHGPVYRPITELAEALQMPVAPIEEAVRKMEGVSVLAVGAIEQEDFPRIQRKGGEKGFYPGIKLETEGERMAKETRAEMIRNAIAAINAEVACFGLTAIYGDDDTFTLAAGDDASALQNVLAALQ